MNQLMYEQINVLYTQQTCNRWECDPIERAAHHVPRSNNQFVFVAEFARLKNFRAFGKLDRFQPGI